MFDIYYYYLVPDIPKIPGLQEGPQRTPILHPTPAHNGPTGLHAWSPQPLAVHHRNI